MSIINVFNVFVFILIKQGKSGLADIDLAPSMIDLMGGGGVSRGLSTFALKEGGGQGMFGTFTMETYFFF